MINNHPKWNRHNYTHLNELKFRLRLIESRPPLLDCPTLLPNAKPDCWIIFLNCNLAYCKQNCSLEIGIVLTIVISEHVDTRRATVRDNRRSLIKIASVVPCRKVCDVGNSITSARSTRESPRLMILTC